MIVAFCFLLNKILFTIKLPAKNKQNSSKAWKLNLFYKISKNPIIAGKKQLKSLCINTFNSIMKIIKIDFSSI